MQRTTEDCMLLNDGSGRLLSFDKKQLSNVVDKKMAHFDDFVKLVAS